MEGGGGGGMEVVRRRKVEQEPKAMTPHSRVMKLVESKGGPGGQNGWI